MLVHLWQHIDGRVSLACRHARQIHAEGSFPLANARPTTSHPQRSHGPSQDRETRPLDDVFIYTRPQLVVDDCTVSAVPILFGLLAQRAYIAVTIFLHAIAVLVPWTRAVLGLHCLALLNDLAHDVEVRLLQHGDAEDRLEGERRIGRLGRSAASAHQPSSQGCHLTLRAFAGGFRVVTGVVDGCVENLDDDLVG